MNKKTSNKVTMYEGLLTVLNENADKVSPIEGFANAVEKFSQVTKAIANKDVEASESRKGKTETKHSYKEDLHTLLLPVCSALHLTGKAADNQELMAKAECNESDLTRMKDNDLLTFATTAVTEAKANASAILPKGISAEMLNDLEAKLAAFKASIGKQGSGVSSGKEARATMKDLIKKADDIIKNELDHYMKIARRTDEEFYTKYTGATVIKDLGIRHKKDTEPAEPVAAR